MYTIPSAIKMYKAIDKGSCSLKRSAALRSFPVLERVGSEMFSFPPGAMPPPVEGEWWKEESGLLCPYNAARMTSYRDSRKNLPSTRIRWNENLLMAADHMGRKYLNRNFLPACVPDPSRDKRYRNKNGGGSGQFPCRRKKGGYKPMRRSLHFFLPTRRTSFSKLFGSSQW